MIGNNSCGASAQAYGKTVDNVRRLEILTYDGLRCWVGPTSPEEYQEIVAAGGRRAEIYRAPQGIVDRHLAHIPPSPAAGRPAATRSPPPQKGQTGQSAANARLTSTASPA
jgi:hypothetical protein